jgi:hypothetical protein
VSRGSPVFKVIVCALDDRDSVSAEAGTCLLTTASSPEGPFLEIMGTGGSFIKLRTAVP